MQTVIEGMAEGSVFDPRAPKHDRFDRDPQKMYEDFMSRIPKISDIKSLKEIEPEPDFIAEQMEYAENQTRILKDSLVSICKTFEVVEKKDLIKKTDSVLKLFQSKDFGLDEIKKGGVELMQIQGELLLSLEIYGGTQHVQLGNARAAAKAFTRLLEVY